jgi:hypothetical protein
MLGSPARRIGEWQGRSVLDEQFDDATHIELLVVGECGVPVCELVSPFDFPRHDPSMP